jgi:hypothetical protein
MSAARSGLDDGLCWLGEGDEVAVRIEPNNVAENLVLLVLSVVVMVVRFGRL